MSISLSPKIELCESKSISLRDKIIRDHPDPAYQKAGFVDVIFNGLVDIEIEFQFPTCELIPIQGDRLQHLLGGDTDSINDYLHDATHVSQLSDSHLEALKDLLHVSLVSECMEYTLFLDTNMCCKTNQLSKTTKKIVYRNRSLPHEPYVFCWLQLLPLVQAYPRTYIPPLNQEAMITDVRIMASECSVITGPAGGDQSFFIDMVKKKEGDVYSFLFRNQTPYDINCIYKQCQTFLKKNNSSTESSSYLIQFIQFLVYDPKAGLPYMAKKLTQRSSSRVHYLWYL